jgi:DNA-binding PadR family transcriptional regulator
MYSLTGFQRDLLYVVAGSDRPSGQGIKQRLESDFETTVNHGRLYPNLDTLVSKDYVEKGQIDRRTNYYAITERGSTAIRERREWEDRYVDL